jgi:hypothetical protein
MTTLAGSTAQPPTDKDLVELAIIIADCYPHQLHDDQAHDLDAAEVAQVLYHRHPAAGMARCESAARQAHQLLGLSDKLIQ